MDKEIFENLKERVYSFLDTATHDEIEWALRRANPNWHWKDRAFKQSIELMNIGKNWDSYGAEPPNTIAVNNVICIIDKIDIKPIVIAPNPDEGITLTFESKKGNLVSIEADNDGTIFVIIHNEEEESEIYEIENNFVYRWCIVTFLNHY